MRIGFNEGSNWNCAGHSIMADLELCEANGFDYIELQSRCLDEELAAGIVTLEQIADWFRGHKLQVGAYNAFCFFNMNGSAEADEAKMDEFREVIRRCEILGIDTVVVVPSEDLDHPATIPEIREDAVRLLRRMLELSEKQQLKLALEFCGQPNVSIARFEDAWAIVQEVDHPRVGLVFDNYHFHAMGSSWADLEAADGKKIFVWHMNDTEDLPVAAPYNTYANRLFPGDPRGCMDFRRYVDTLRKIGYPADACAVEVFRPEYYELSQEENVRRAAESMKAFAAAYG